MKILINITRMIRRTNSKAPNFILVGSVIIIVILGYNYWILASKNGDLEKEIEKLQAEVKISGVKQEQFEKKNVLLQENVQEMDAKASKLQKQIEQEDKQMDEINNLVKEKEFVITSLQSKLTQKNDEIKALTQQIEEKDLEINGLQQDNAKIESQRDEAYDAIGDKDAKYKELRAELERELAVVSEYEAQLEILKETLAKTQLEMQHIQREGLAAADPGPVPGMMNLPSSMKKEPYFVKGSLGYIKKNAVQSQDKAMEGVIFHHEMPIIPHQLPNVPRSKARFSVADIGKGEREQLVNKPRIKDQIDEFKEPQPPKMLDRPDKPQPPQMLDRPDHQLQSGQNQAPPPPFFMPGAQSSSSIPPRQFLVKPLEPDQNHQEGPKNNNIKREIENPISNGDPVQVIPLPPQNPPENLDAAIDEEERVIEDPLDDQDEEGKEIKRDLENNAEENYNHIDYDNGKGHNLHPEDTLSRDKYPEPQGIGAGEMSKFQFKKDNRQEDFNGEDVFQNHANDRVYDTKLENNIRNLGQM